MTCFNTEDNSFIEGFLYFALTDGKTVKEINENAVKRPDGASDIFFITHALGVRVTETLDLKQARAASFWMALKSIIENGADKKEVWVRRAPKIEELYDSEEDITRVKITYRAAWGDQ